GQGAAQPGKFYQGLEDQFFEFAEAALRRTDPKTPVKTPCPIEVLHLWDHFNQLYDPDTGGMGPARLSYQEIDAYCRTTGTKFTNREVRLLRRLSDLYL